MAIADTTNPHIIVLGGTRNKFMSRIEKFYRSEEHTSELQSH